MAFNSFDSELSQSTIAGVVGVVGVVGVGVVGVGVVGVGVVCVVVVVGVHVYTCTPGRGYVCGCCTGWTTSIVCAGFAKLAFGAVAFAYPKCCAEAGTRVVC